ncbi:MAG: hypothetical protein WBV60_04325 [Terriglobales bacterium]
MSLKLPSSVPGRLMDMAVGREVGYASPQPVTTITACDCLQVQTTCGRPARRDAPYELRADASDQMDYPGETHGIHQTASA